MSLFRTPLPITINRFLLRGVVAVLFSLGFHLVASGASERYLNLFYYNNDFKCSSQASFIALAETRPACQNRPAPRLDFSVCDGAVSVLACFLVVHQC